MFTVQVFGYEYIWILLKVKKETFEFSRDIRLVKNIFEFIEYRWIFQGDEILNSEL